ncbi:ribosome maturation factor RimP [Pullulanibacillus sp. KACC 23026]|uniref:ribosome maturation factor RimP n=1 Tax=Pullulanibacillus sp. KACC 23026 TaxID=3028315 RepID=UPI0023B0A6AF|nr:ribosome maturation factor RimP [Pullulanibacillus sp. KACC 23026]WEG11585.1 ribosome maturation factor RimP [Pullulanibacillus sp. KACC 23026]
MAGRIVELTTEICKPILDSLDLELVDVEYVKEGKNMFLRVFIDSPIGVDLDMCSRVSEQLSEALDEHDPIKDPYFLEVSSPGAERPLKNVQDYQKAKGKNVRITTYEMIDKAKVFEGILKEVAEDFLVVTVRIKTQTKDVTIPFEKIASARLAVIF